MMTDDIAGGEAGPVPFGRNNSANPEPPEFSDDALALQFAARHVDNLRYVAAWGRYLFFDGTVWRFDTTLKVFDRARRLNREIQLQCDQKRLQADIVSASTVAATVNLARVDRRIAATVEQWDANTWLLNTPGGVVDLQTGDCRPARPDDYMTKITAVAPGGSCPLWLSCLDCWTGGDKELQAYLRRLMGYSLTGQTREHALFFLFGTGANGKGIFVNTLVAILAEYARITPVETLTDSRSEQHPTNLAALRGARLVSASETEQGRRWNEARIKSLTGGDKIAARFMRQDFFEFIPEFKLLISGNHKPGLRTVDEAIRRRLHLVPFSVTIKAGDRDPGLFEKLRAEWPGILQWAIDGAREWAGEGLRPPECVRAATAEYLEAEDALSLWLGECCVKDVNGWTPISALFASYKAWADKVGEPAGSARRLSQALQDRGLAPERRGKDRHKGIAGIALTQPEFAPPPHEVDP